MPICQLPCSPHGGTRLSIAVQSSSRPVSPPESVVIDAQRLTRPPLSALCRPVAILWWRGRPIVGLGALTGILRQTRSSQQGAAGASLAGLSLLKWQCFRWVSTSRSFQNPSVFLVSHQPAGVTRLARSVRTHTSPNRLALCLGAEALRRSSRARSGAPRNGILDRIYRL